jgi:hypothetical protein
MGAAIEASDAGMEFRLQAESLNNRTFRLQAELHALFKENPLATI